MARNTSPATEQPAVENEQQATPGETSGEQATPDETSGETSGEQATPDETSGEGDGEGEVAPLTDDEYVARVRAGYGRLCAACESKMLGGQGLTLNEYREPIHRSCA